MPFVSITRLRVRGLRFMPAFFLWAMRTSQQAATAPGCLHASVLRDTDRVFWTRTVWDNEAAMRSYLLGGAHGKVMHRLMDCCDEASVVHWDQDSAAPPPWPGIDEIMTTRGRRSKVKHPNAAHTAFSVRPPTVGRTRMVTFRSGAAPQPGAAGR